MSKHNQSAALGSLSDFATSPGTPEDRLERIETRLENIEKLLNTVLYAISDLNLSFDKASKTAETPAPKAKQQPAPKQKKQNKNAKIKGKSKSFTSHFTPEQMAEINANKDSIKALFADRESLTKAEAVERLELDPKIIGRVLSILVEDGFLTMTKPKPTIEIPDPKVIFTRK